MNLIKSALCAFALVAASPVAATTLDLQYVEMKAGTSQSTTTITESPVLVGGVKAAPLTTIAGGFEILDLSGTMGSFTAWCLDLENYLRPRADYVATSTPFSNVTTFSDETTGRLQAVFDANYLLLDPTDVVQSAAFQLALWETVYDGPNMDLTSGLFQAEGYWQGANTTTALAISDTAAGFLDAATSYGGESMFDLTFLESTGAVQSQALVTAQYNPQSFSATSVGVMPLPGGVVFLLTGLGGFAALRRRARG